MKMRADLLKLILDDTKLYLCKHICQPGPAYNELMKNLILQVLDVLSVGHDQVDGADRGAHRRSAR